jgi:hypothetical protein
MKISKELEGKRVHIKMRMGGSYIGIITKVDPTSTWIKPDGQGDAVLSNGMIGSVQLLVEESNKKEGNND